MTSTYLRKLVEKSIPDLDTWMHGQRLAGKSWRKIADEVRQITAQGDPDDGVNLNYETLRKWYGPDRENTEVSP